MYRILIVEDDATMAKAMKTQIDSWDEKRQAKMTCLSNLFVFNQS